MRKFSGKCFIYKSRGVEPTIATIVSFGGEAGFDTGRNKMSCRRNEPNGHMSTRETNHWSVTRGKDEPACRHIAISNATLKSSRGDTTGRRRNNENYDG